jgi:hypothetical protein
LGALLTFAIILRWGAENNRYGLLRRFIKKKYPKRHLLRCLHTQSSIAHHLAQSAGEKRDVSTKMRDALQQFVPRCVFRATFPALIAINFYDLKTTAARQLLFFYVNSRNCRSKKYVARRYAASLSEICSLIARQNDGRRGCEA